LHFLACSLVPLRGIALEALESNLSARNSRRLHFYTAKPQKPTPFHWLSKQPPKNHCGPRKLVVTLRCMDIDLLGWEVWAVLHRVNTSGKLQSKL
jgi:hypothetical protein